MRNHRLSDPSSEDRRIVPINASVFLGCGRQFPAFCHYWCGIQKEAVGLRLDWMRMRQDVEGEYSGMPVRHFGV